jgi:tetratricopeptide (TPR) repeat protein
MDSEIQATAEELFSAKLENAERALAADPESTAASASEVLDAYPGQSQALLLLLSALNVIGVQDGARDLLEWMSQEHPNLASIHYELGILLARLGVPEEAIRRLSRAVELEPNHPAAWRALGNQLALTGDTAGASRACARHVILSLRELKLLEDKMAVCRADEFAKAETMLQQALAISPTDIAITRLLGELYLRLGKLREAEITLERALELAPDCMESRDAFCIALTQLMDWRRANEQLEILLQHSPGNLRLEAMLAANLVMLGEREEAVRRFEELRTEGVTDRVFWLNYGHAARVIGKDDQAMIEAYRKCLEADPTYGTAWWGLADMKIYRFLPNEIATMREQLKRDDIPDGQRCQLQFALARALEDEGAYAESFELYTEANALRRAYITYDADRVHDEMERVKAFFTADFFAARNDAGCPSPDPIFIVGMPRAGSTLIEQILSSHSQVEGTMELPDLGNMVGEMIRKRAAGKPWPNLLADFDEAELVRLGEDYLERTRCQRKLGRPLFTDKAGNNFLHIGLIQVILPNAKIIDARRHPLSCGFSCFKQAFAPGALLLAYDQTDIGRYYSDYVEIMAHYDRVLPGRVHRIFHEELVRDPEAEIQRILAYCNLPFEEQCMRFYETDRSIRTSSSQQVRQPIQKKKVEAWQHFETWLEPMKNALGDVLTRYPDVPDTF